MQPEDPFNPPAPVPDLPDAAMPSIEPVSEQPPAAPTPPPSSPLPQPQPPSQNGAKKDQGESHLSSIGKKYFKYIEFDDEEILLTEIRKHPFGLFIIFLTSIFVALVLLTTVTVIASSGILNSLGLGDISALVVF